MSAFCPPCNIDLPKWLQNEAKIPLTLMYTGGVTRKLTLGLKQTYSEISATKAFGRGSLVRSNMCNAQGQLIVGKSFPLLSKRYKLLDSVGLGTFSQIYKATDCFTGRSVAVKIMNRGLDMLGNREILFLRYFAMRCRRGINPCKSLPLAFTGSKCDLVVELLDSFCFEQEFMCLCMNLYNTTLLDLIVLPEYQASTPSRLTNGYTYSVGIVAPQPR